MRSYWKVKTENFLLLFFSWLFQLSGKPDFQPCSFSLQNNEHPFHLFFIYLSRPTILKNIIPLPSLSFFLPLLDHLILCKPVQFSHSQHFLGRNCLYKANEQFLWANLFFPTALITSSWAFPVAQMVKHLPAMWETWVWSLGQEDPLEEGMATHSSTLAWKIPWTEEPGRLQSMGSQRVRDDWATSLSLNHILLKILQSFQSNRKEFQIQITFTSAIKMLNNVKTSIIWCSI